MSGALVAILLIVSVFAFIPTTDTQGEHPQVMIYGYVFDENEEGIKVIEVTLMNTGLDEIAEVNGDNPVTTSEGGYFEFDV